MLILDAESALRLTQILISISLLVGSAEIIALRSTLSKIPGRFPSKFVALLVVTQVVFSAVLLMGLGPTAIVVPLFVATILLNVHFRGSFNGGSDTMTLVVLSGLSGAALFADRPLAIQAALIYIAAQSLLSYALAGLSKLRRSGWRNARTLREYLLDSDYDVPESIKNWLSSHPSSLLGIAWITVVFEVSVLPAMFSPTLLLVWMCCGMLFHLANFAVLGLNRFVFVWLATYPALLFLAGRTLS